MKGQRFSKPTVGQLDVFSEPHEPVEIIEPGVFRTDPVLRPDAEGTIYYCSQKVVDNVDSVQFFKSIDGGVTWGPAFEAFGGDKSWFAIDQTGGIGHGNIYLYWSFFSCCGSNVFTRSTDDAQSFMEPIPLFAEPKIGQLALSSDGVLYVAGFMPGLGQEGQRVAFLGSTNAQDPAQTPVFDIATPVDMGPTALLAGPNPAGLLGQVNLAVDTSGGPTHGNIYLLVSADPPGSDPVDVMFARSTDGGVTFSEPVRINDDVGDDAWQWFGTLSVAPNGRLDVVWNDTRNSGVENVSELFYASSRNGGETWSPNVALSPPWDSHIGWPQQDKIGDYYDMASDDGGAHLAWAATFNGEQDVYYLRINDCPWDCANGDGQIDIVEFLAVLSLWGTGHIDEPCDFDGDGEVGINEFLTVLGMWGPCP